MVCPRVQAPAPLLTGQFGRVHQGSKADGLTFNLVYGSPQTLSWCRSSSLVPANYLLCSSLGRFAIRQLGPWRQKQNFGATNFPFHPNEHVLESLRLPAPMPVLKVILTVSEITSGAASTGVANLKAATEMTNTKSIYYQSEPTV